MWGEDRGNPQGVKMVEPVAGQAEPRKMVTKKKHHVLESALNFACMFQALQPKPFGYSLKPVNDSAYNASRGVPMVPGNPVGCLSAGQVGQYVEKTAHEKTAIGQHILR